MSEYQVLARKYRPQIFRDVVAQMPLTVTLKNAIRLKRTAHAYLFCGTKGTGKTTLARLFAKALNCLHLSEEMEPCNACSSCKEIASSHAIDVLEIDGASHRGIEDIRQINETIGFVPTGGKYKIYLIDEVHMLTKEAFNALLKTLEEPPSHVKFFFCTTEAHKIPATILSRCQRFHLRRIPLQDMVNQLAVIASKENVNIEKEALETIAERAEGSMRDALSVFDQIIAFEKEHISSQTVADLLGMPPKEIFFALDQAGTKKDFKEPFRIAEEIFLAGTNSAYFLQELIAHYRIHLLLKNGAPYQGHYKQRYAETNPFYRLEQLVDILELLAKTQQSIKQAPSERIAIEILLLQIVRTHQHISLDLLVQRLISLENSFNITEDPTPKPEELPPPKAPKPKPPSPPPKPASIKEQSRFDTVMRFAAKELNGSLKKE